MPYFQITEPFIAGNDFFDMVDHYLLLLHNVKTEIQNNEAFAAIKNILSDRNGTGFCYAKNLFYCALLCYYDKFHNFDEMAVKKLFIWAFMIRVDMENLGFDTINKYAIGNENPKYSNTIAMFSKINLARLHTEIVSLQIKIPLDIKPNNSSWAKLHNELKKLIGNCGGVK